MAGPFVTIRFHATETDASSLRDLQPIHRGPASPRTPEKDFADDEAAARFYLARLLSNHPDSTVRGLAAPRKTGILPDLKLVRSHSFDLAESRDRSRAPARDPNEPPASARLLCFAQTRSGIEIFGANAIAELDSKRQPLSLAAELAPAFDVSKYTSIKETDALDRIAAKTGKSTGSLTAAEAVEKVFFYDDRSKRWRLTYFFKEIPAAPAGFADPESWRVQHKGTLDPPPSLYHPEMNYLVDAHDGEIVFYYSAMHYNAKPLCRLQGVDELDVCHEFYGQIDSQTFEMIDPLSGIKTFDLRFAEVGSRLDDSGLQVPKSDLGTTNRAAVSACVNARRVYDFFSSVLKRHGIDGKNAELVSVVNSTLQRFRPTNEWRNACWWKGCMWYGQYHDSKRNRLVSFAEYLDIVAHELTHGITEATSNLIYHGLSGALNESFSDIFGILIKNWYDTEAPLEKDLSPGRESVHKKWSWEIGPGLGMNNGPLRDLSDPARTGDPAHMDQYVPQEEDSGGVHRFSAIHNKAAYNVLMACDAGGKHVFSPREVALLYYLALIRLNRNAVFTDALRALRDATSTYFSGDNAERQSKLNAIAAAYEKVGIHLDEPDPRR